MRDETDAVEETPQGNARSGLLLLGMVLITFAWGFGLGFASGYVFP